MATNAMAFITVQNSNVHGQRSQRPLMPPVDDKIVTQELIDYFEIVIRGVSMCPSSLVRDCAVICAFLQSKKLFNEFYERVVDPELKAARDWNKHQTQALDVLDSATAWKAPRSAEKLPLNGSPQAFGP